MKNKLLYIVEEDYVSKSVFTDKEIRIYSLKSEVKNIAKKHFLSIESYYKLIRKQLPLKNKIPIYFSNSLLLFTLNSKSTKYMINFYNLLKVCSCRGLKFIFKNGSILNLDISKAAVKKEMVKINNIISYLNDLNL